MTVAKLWRELPGAAKTALICAVLGFVITIDSTTVKSSRGDVNCSYTNISALGFGAAAGIAGVVALVLGAKRRHRATLVVGAVCVAVAVLHVLRGVGSVGGACN